MSRIILVLGMHRSGTSLVAKSLECLGVSLGDDAEWYGPDNQSGFWEGRAILNLDELVLQRYGAQWHSLDVDLTKPVIISDLTAHAQRILGDKLRRFPLLGIKEPRMCRLLPFWKPILYKIGCQVSVVTTWRRDTEIAKSLEKRNGIPIKDGLMLARAHSHAVTQGLQDTDWKVVPVSFNSMRLHPDTEIRFIGHKLGLGVDEAKLAWFKREFVRKEAA